MKTFIVTTQRRAERVRGTSFEISPGGTLWIRCDGKDVAFNQFYWQRVEEA